MPTPVHELLTKARKDKGYTQDYVSKAIGCRRATLSDLERGVTPVNGFERLAELKELLDFAPIESMATWEVPDLPSPTEVKYLMDTDLFRALYQAMSNPVELYKASERFKDVGEDLGFKEGGYIFNIPWLIDHIYPEVIDAVRVGLNKSGWDLATWQSLKNEEKPEHLWDNIVIRLIIRPKEDKP